MIVNFLKGIFVGLCASIPLGPVGILCIQRTLSKGKASGFFTGLGAAASDTLFAALALLSLSFVNRLLEDYRDWVMIIGGIIVIIFGAVLFFNNPVKQIKRLKSGNKVYWKDFFSTVLMTLTNPGAFFLMLGILAFVGINVGEEGSLNIIAVTLAGITTGAILWWYTLTTSINLFRNKLRLKQLVMVNKVSGILIAILGMISIFEGIYRFIF